MVLCTYLGMRCVTGSGVLAFPVNQDSNGQPDRSEPEKGGMM